ncbi:hypothetical protein MSAN_00869400 [Mycena sanguinolenta]|uniref:Uncharacterized protein n=1 Tax=Mycena sanguinolenta TaxID=230812 RepID=A0A8H7DB75_9AGAR|nr:hypothetical protein MSAN_00869400 [Mycena sanguinolenta]
MTETQDRNQPDWRLTSPFKWEWGEGGILADREFGRRPRRLAELRMYTLSWAIRIKPDWQRKASDPEILSKWRQEALDQQGPLEYEERMTEKMVDYVLAELDGYAKIADNIRGIERGCFDAIWYSDRLISDDLTERLKTVVRILENVPDSEKDWHPGSNKQVLDLVHPSLYCIVYDRTHAYDPQKPRVPANVLPVVAPTFGDDDGDSVADWSISSAFSWLPSDFSVGLDGSVKLVSPYINNLHPEKHQVLYHVIEEILGAFIPMFDRVLGDNDDENPLACDGQRLEAEQCIWGDEGPEGGGPTYDEYLAELVLGEGEEPPDEDYWYDNIRDEWKESKKILPEAVAYKGQLEQTLSKISLRGRTIQCIIKLANIHLTPDRPEYEGGSWHVEGMANEHIVASGIYYYDEENITETRLSFRVATRQPEYHTDREDHNCVYTLYGFASKDPCVQDLGEMVTKKGRALSWPNQYQHCVSPFKLSDPSRPGHRKILAIFLVNPTIKHIPSATVVPPQQAEWASEVLQESHQDRGSRVSRLPQEVVDLAKVQLPTTFMTRKEAEEYRLALMKERTVFVKTYKDTACGVTMNMCEH